MSIRSAELHPSERTGAHPFDALDRRVAAVFQDLLSRPGWEPLIQPSFPADAALDILFEIFDGIDAVGAATADLRTAAGLVEPGRGGARLLDWQGQGAGIHLHGQARNSARAATQAPAVFSVVAVWRRIAQDAEPAALLGAEYLYQQLAALITHEADCILRLRRIEAEDTGLDALLQNDANDRANALREAIFDYMGDQMEADNAIMPALLFGHDCLAQVYPLAVFDEALTRALEG